MYYKTKLNTLMKIFFKVSTLMHMHFGILLYCPLVFLFLIIDVYVKESEVAQ